jgi:hypothetical protein
MLSLAPRTCEGIFQNRQSVEAPNLQSLQAARHEFSMVSRRQSVLLGMSEL